MAGLSRVAEDAPAVVDASSPSVLTAAITAALDAVPVPADQVPSPRKAALISRRRRLALAIGVFHRRNRLRSIAYPAAALACAAADAALCAGLFALPGQWIGGFIVPLYVSAGATVVYTRRALATRPDQRAAAAAELGALKLREPGSLPPRPGAGLT